MKKGQADDIFAQQDEGSHERGRSRSAQCEIGGLVDVKQGHQGLEWADWEHGA
jgi:hypothetical protein